MSDCKGCPDSNQPKDTPSREDVVKSFSVGTSNAPKHPEIACSKPWIIYTGGPPEAHLGSLRLITPDNIKVGSDGTLEYEKKPGGFEPPSVIDGYERDSNNQWIFKPLWKSCSMRHFNVSLKSSCQCIDVIARCGKTFQMVKCIDCDQCGNRVEIPELKMPIKKTLKSLQYPEGLPLHSSRLTKSDRA